MSQKNGDYGDIDNTKFFYGFTQSILNIRHIYKVGRNYRIKMVLL